jgi:hypothetical protein
VLDGCDETVSLDLPHIRRPKHANSPSSVLPAMRPIGDVSVEYLDLCEQHAGCGVHDLDTSDKAWSAIKRIFGNLKGCPKGNDKGRHQVLRDSAWELAHLVAEAELTEDLARKAYFKAAEGISNRDKKYGAAAIQERWDDAFANTSGRRM